MDGAYPHTIGDRGDNASLKYFQIFICDHLFHGRIDSTIFCAKLKAYGHHPLKCDARTQMDEFFFNHQEYYLLSCNGFDYK